MCDGVKDWEKLWKQYQKATDEGIDLIEIEMLSGNVIYRDRWKVREMLQYKCFSDKEKEMQDGKDNKADG